MSEPKPQSQTGTRWLGALCAAMGLYFMLAGLDIVPAGKRNPGDPLWVGFLAGFLFFVGGLAVILQGIGKANDQGELPADAPRWMRAAQYAMGVLLFGCFALLGTYVSLAGDERGFAGGIPFLGHGSNVSIARVAFGIGAIICWLATLGFAVQGARKILRRPGR